MKPMTVASLCIILLIAIWGSFYIFSGQTLSDISRELSDTIYTSVSDENWDSALYDLDAVLKNWETNKTVLYMLSNHSTIRDTDVSLARLKELIKNEEASDAHAEIGAILEMLLSIRQGEAFALDNIL